MSNYPDGMTRADYIAVGEIEPNPEPQETVVLRATVYLWYSPSPDPTDDSMEECQSPYQAEKNIAAVLGRATPYGLEYRTDKIEVIDAEYLTEEQARE